MGIRKIIFRGKRLDNGEWVYGELCTPRLFDNKRGYFGEDVPCFFCDEGNVPINPESVGQFTGLLDKNGKEIYEGDIVNVRQGERNFDIVVKWSNEAMAFMAYYADGNQSPLSWFSDLRMYQLRVIGSIHDNPELLNEK